MDFVSDPPISKKIALMEERVRWHHPEIKARGIDQTRLVLEGSTSSGKKGGPEGSSDTSLENAFSFLVIGDTGAGKHRGDHPQRRVAKRMIEESHDCDFVLHTGDVVYLVGSSEQYPDNFIKPYRELLVNGDRPNAIDYDRMTFKRPMFTVLGNHDYYDLPLVYGITAQVTLPLRYLMRRQLDMNFGLHGSRVGDAYSRAFLDYLKSLGPGQLAQHLDQHYTAKTDTGRCLTYKPGEFTRLPNRYYWFRHQGIEFYALDTNTFNAPDVVPNTAGGEVRRDYLQQQQADWRQQQEQILEQAAALNKHNLDEADDIGELQAKYEQIEEEIRDAEKQLNQTQQSVDVDTEQLGWLRQRLTESWQTYGSGGEVRGRVVFFHHPPYVTEATKWNQGQTLAVRYRLRRVFDQVKQAAGDCIQERPVVDVVFTGHAHCFDHLRTEDIAGHGDAGIHWVVCGGSGYSLRRQRIEGSILFEHVGDNRWPVARSHLFVGRTGYGARKRRPYTFARVDVSADTPARFTVRPHVVEMAMGRWRSYALDPLSI
ncbi:MAG: metallophosphoesterase [Elainellaceae cyanobacterium]